MTLSTVRMGTADGELAKAFAASRNELGLSDKFPPEVEAEAAAAVATVTLPDTDLLDLPFLTIDPADSMDLDQAMCLERDGDGYRVQYAIADVPAFVKPGGEIDAEARKRGQTMYPPDGRIPLHPAVISEGAASLLPGEVRGAFVWTFELDDDARLTKTSLVLARVRSRERLSYQQVQEQIDGKTAPPGIALLKEIGLKLIALEQERGGASLGRPDQEVRMVGGKYDLVLRRPAEAEAWNAQISLLTGMAAAQLMLDGGVGILRTMPPASNDSITWFRRRAKALGHEWGEGQGYGAYLRTLDPDDPRQLAIMHAAASLFRGAGYTAFDTAASAHGASSAEPVQASPARTELVQAAVAAPYAHATAPLRRLVDRFTLVVCEALANGREVPGWAREALPTLPAIMAASDGLAGRLDHATVSAVEAAVLSAHVGEAFAATVISTKNGGGELQLDGLAVTAGCTGSMSVGEIISARLVTADIATGTVEFVRIDDDSPSWQIADAP